jgi:hypothetical protein
VGLDGGGTDLEVPGQLVVGQAPGDQGEHLALAAGDPVKLRREETRWLGAAGELGDEAAGHARREQGLARGHGPDRGDEAGRRGTIRITFLALPRRRIVLAAKAAVVAVVAFVTGEVAVAATYVPSQAIIGGRPIHGQPAMSIALFLGYGLSVMVSALLGLSLGTLTRSAAASIATLAALWYVLPIVAFHLPPSWHAWLGSLMPGALAGELAGTGNPDSVYGSVLSPAGALAVMAAYVVLPLAAAALLIGWTDA